jgi:hypothetical protein
VTGPTGRTGPAGATGATGPTGGGSLDGLSDVTILGTPQDGQVLVYNGLTGANRWQNDFFARLDFIDLSNDDQALSIRVNTGTRFAQAGLDLSTIPNNTTRTYTFPNASGTIALQNSFTVIQQVLGTYDTVTGGNSRQATVSCPSGYKVIGVGLDANHPVQVQWMFLDLANNGAKVQVTGISGTTTYSPVAICMPLF